MKAPFYVALVLLLSGAAAAPSYAEEKKKASSFNLEFPLVPVRIVADVEGIKNQPLEVVSQTDKETINYRYLAVPRFRFVSRDVSLQFSPDLFVLRDPASGAVRENFQARVLAERSVWLFLTGLEGRYLEEDISNVLADENYRLDLHRRSYGGTFWGGAKLGGFDGNFAAVRVGIGLAQLETGETYTSLVFKRGFEIPIYHQRLESRYFSAEAQTVLWRFTPSVKFEQYRYRGLGEPEGTSLSKIDTGSFDHSVVTIRLEAPLLAANRLRLVAERNEHFGGPNRATLENEKPKWQAYLRLVF